MKICVLVKQVPDKDSNIKLTSDGLKVDESGLNFLTNEISNEIF